VLTQLLDQPRALPFAQVRIGQQQDVHAPILTPPTAVCCSPRAGSPAA
jgi:hypothetical protein